MPGNKVYVQGSYIDIHDNENVYLSVDKAEVKLGAQPIATPKPNAQRPEALCTPEALEAMQLLQEAELLDADWQPIKLSGPERGLVAREVCLKLEINEVWQTFGQLWGEKPETLRGYMNKAMDQKKSLDFQKRLKNILY